MRKLFRASSVFVGAALAVGALAGCGGGSTNTSTAALCSQTLQIVTEFAVSGTDAGAQIPAQNGADLAITQNSNLGHGCSIKVKHDNYEGTNGVDTSIASSNITADVSDPSIIAVDGPFNSGVAKVIIGTTTRAHLVMISPANTNPGLTLSQYAQANGIDFAQLHPAGFPEAYFRLPGNDVVQGKVDAEVAAAAPISCTNAYGVDDDTTYGIGLWNYTQSTFTSNGGKVVGHSSIQATQASSFPSLAATIKGTNPDCVFLDGVTSGGLGILWKDLVNAGFKGPAVGGDGIAEDPAWLTTAGSAAGNTYGSVAAPDTSQLTSGVAASFVSAYKSTYPSADLTPYAAMSYDATMIEINAIKNVIASGKQVTREAVRAAVQSISYDGVTGHITFDQNGDNAGTKVFSIYGVQNGAWAFVKEVNA
jgi:branched-chain amino acid transport system substrate-binding protein